MALTVFGFNPGSCITVLCSQNGKCEERNYCNENLVNNYNFNSGQNIIDLKTLNIAKFTQSQFFVVIHDKKGWVFKLGDSNSITNFADNENLISLDSKSYFSELSLLTKSSLFSIKFTKDSQVNCHNYCQVSDCNFSFSRSSCIGCDSPYVAQI